LVLMSEERKKAGFAAVRESFERLVFQQPKKKAAILAEVKATMYDINRLLEEKKAMSWSRTWLDAVGVEETNPATLALLHFSGWISTF